MFQREYGRRGFWRVGFNGLLDVEMWDVEMNTTEGKEEEARGERGGLSGFNAVSSLDGS